MHPSLEIQQVSAGDNVGRQHPVEGFIQQWLARHP
jgi:hypothetical protein